MDRAASEFLGQLCGQRWGASAALAVALFALAAPQPTGAVEIVLVGDSITVPRRVFGPSFAELVAGEFGASSVEVRAAGGTTTRNWFPDRALYINSEFDLLAPRVAHILLGINDASVLHAIEPTEYGLNLRATADALIEDGARFVMLTAAPPGRAPQDVILDRLAAYRDTVDDLCAPPGDALLCGPDLWIVLGPGHYDIDGVHPNGPGHAAIAAALIPLLLPEPPAELAAGAALGVVAWLQFLRARRTD